MAAHTKERTFNNFLNNPKSNAGFSAGRRLRFGAMEDKKNGRANTTGPALNRALRVILPTLDRLTLVEMHASSARLRFTGWKILYTHEKKNRNQTLANRWGSYSTPSSATAERGGRILGASLLSLERGQGGEIAHRNNKVILLIRFQVSVDKQVI